MNGQVMDVLLTLVHLIVRRDIIITEQLEHVQHVQHDILHQMETN